MSATLNEIPSTQLITHLQKFIPTQMHITDVLGATVALVRDARIAWAGAFGVMHADLGFPLSPSSVFEAASLSKPVVAYAALKLCARGLLELDVPLSNYVSGDTITPPAPLGQLTARMVLCHTTGLRNWLWQKDEQPLLSFTPGSRFGYSGLGYSYLQKVIERITDKPLAAHVQSEVLGPLRMAHSSFTWRDDYDADAATGHDADGKPTEKWKPRDAEAAASLHTTALDYARFIIALMNSQNGIAAQMLRSRVNVTAEVSWGLGVGLVHTHAGELFWHWGDNGAFKAFCMASRPHRNGIVVMTNSANGLRLCKSVVGLVMGETATQSAYTWLDEFYK